MSYKFKVMLILGVLTLPLMFFLTKRITTPGRGFLSINGLSTGMYYLAVFGISLAITIIVLLCTLLFSAKGRIQLDIEGELQKNGYSDKYYEMLSAEVNRLAAKNDTKDNLYTDYVSKLANYYLIKGRYTEAYNTINTLNLNVLKYNARKDDAGKMRLLMYYDVQLCVCDDLQDVERAHRIMDDAKEFINVMSGNRSAMMKLAVNEFCSTYYAMIGSYDIATEYATKMAGSDPVNGKFYGNMQFIKILCHQGRFDEAVALLDQTEAEVKKKKIIQDMIRSTREEIERKRCQWQTN